MRKKCVFREKLCSVAGPNCLRLLLCVWLCLSMSNITGHRGAFARANTYTNRGSTIGKAFMVWKTSVTWHLGQTLSNKAIAAHCLEPRPGIICLSDSSFLTSLSWHVTVAGMYKTDTNTVCTGKHWIRPCTYTTQTHTLHTGYTADILTCLSLGSVSVFSRLISSIATLHDGR